MKITNVRLKVTAVEGYEVKAKVDILIDNCLAIKDIKILQRKDNYLIVFPSIKIDGKWENMIYPINQKTRDIFTDKIINKFHQEVINLLGSLKIKKGYDLKVNLSNIHDVALVDILNNKIVDTYDLEDFTSETLEELEEEISIKISELELERVESENE